MTNSNADQLAFATSSPSCKQHDGILQEGLTKREYFAAFAMMGLLANVNGAMTDSGSRNFLPDRISDIAIKHAETLLYKLETLTK